QLGDGEGASQVRGASRLPVGLRDVGRGAERVRSRAVGRSEATARERRRSAGSVGCWWVNGRWAEERSGGGAERARSARRRRGSVAGPRGQPAAGGSTGGGPRSGVPDRPNSVPYCPMGPHHVAAARLSDVPLPAADFSIPAWPGETVLVDGISLH